MHPICVEEPAGKRQEPQTPDVVSFCSSAALHTHNHRPVIRRRHRMPKFYTPFVLQRAPSTSRRLAGSGSNLNLRTLGALLAHVSLGLALGGGGSVLGLLGLLGSLGSGLLLLVLSDGLGAGGRSGLGAHRPALLDDLEGSTNDGSLGLDGTASALLGNLLQRVSAAVHVALFLSQVLSRAMGM